MRRPSIFLVAPIALALALGIARCGSSSSSSSAASQPANTPSSTTSTSTSSAAGGRYGQSTSTATSTTTAAAVITTKHAKFGTILAYGPKKLTVYLFEADKGPHSSCSGACARAWPPVTGVPKAAGGAKSAELGTITRPDGGKQVTYNGHPLYLFVKDKDDGDTYGEALKNFGAEWYALSPSGNKIDVS